jgi:hypothetical protein
MNYESRNVWVLKPEHVFSFQDATVTVERKMHCEGWGPSTPAYVPVISPPIVGLACDSFLVVDAQPHSSRGEIIGRGSRCSAVKSPKGRSISIRPPPSLIPNRCTSLFKYQQHDYRQNFHSFYQQPSSPAR